MAAIPTDVFFATIPELSAQLKGKVFTAEDLTRAFSERLQQLGPRYNALALSLHQEALRQAKDVDRELKRDRFRGPLQGIPYGVKDLLAYAGQPTTWGAKPYAAQVFDYNAAVIDKLGSRPGRYSRGQAIHGRTRRRRRLPLSFRVPDRPRLESLGSHPLVRRILQRLGYRGRSRPGALRDRLGVPSGSIVTPAAFCGVTALRPTYGLVSRYGAMALSWTLDKLGPFAHTAEDCGVILQAIAGKDSRDPGSAGKSFYYTPQYTHPLKELKVGYAGVDFAEWAEPAARPAFNAALAVLKAAGIQLVETKLPNFPYGAALSTILNGEMGSIFEPLITSGKVNELADLPQIAGLKASLELPAKDYLKAMRMRRLIQEEVSKLFGAVDILIAPARPGIAPKVDQPLDRAASGAPPQNPGFRSIIQMGNLAGLPALVLPCGFADKMPVALQLVGAPFSENTLLAIGREFQSHTDWHKRHPA